ncbi:citrate synthase [Flexivirga alba]|uniref:citrate synthase (unknown stereospecificity) n=1 Tax=Flexivirga alba TaxID=702742 RepID=A0ABW2AHS2_9MICO
MDRELITTAQAADLLGVRVATVYSYVSRGVLQPAETHRSRHAGSMFLRQDIVAMADSRRRVRRGRFELTIDTAVSSVEPSGVLLYRGHDVAELATRESFEAVAEIVWDGQADDREWAGCPLTNPDPRLTSRDLVLWAISQAAISDPDRESLSPKHFRSAGRRSILAAATAVGLSRGSSAQGRVADRVLAGVATGSPPDDAADAIDVALGLLADHELATSTLAARAAASTGADPYAVMTAGVAALGGVRHGGASGAAYDLLSAAVEGGLPTDGPMPGFGHTVYADTDPRATVLLDLVTDLDDEIAAVTEDLVLHERRRTGLAPNVDLGLAALTLACGLPRHTGEIVFTIARLAGFVAHGIEEQGHPLRFRPRATYTGEPPRSTSGPV